MRIWLVILLTFISLLSESKPYNSQLTIYTEEFPPFNYSKQDVITGINVELVKRSCEAAKIACTFKILPWGRAFHLTQQKENSGLISTSRNDKREKLFHWVGPLVFSKTYFYRLAYRDDIQANTFTDILKYTVGIQRKDIYESVLIDRGFAKGVNLLDFSYKNQEIKLFTQEKLDLIIASELTLPYQLRTVGLKPSDVKPVIELPMPDLQGNFLALNLTVSKQTINLLQQQLDSLVAKGEVQSIIDTYRKNIE